MNSSDPNRKLRDDLFGQPALKKKRPPKSEPEVTTPLTPLEEARRDYINLFEAYEIQFRATEVLLANQEKEIRGLKEKNARLHTSRLSSDRETVNATSAIPMWAFEAPLPFVWVLRFLIPKGYCTILAGDGGTGKSYLATLLALCIALGLPFLGTPVEHGRVLYVDFELDADEFKRRELRILKGLDVSVYDPRLEDRLFYCKPLHPLGTDAFFDEIGALVREHDISLVIIDSLTMGAIGADATSARDFVGVMARLTELGTVLAIDHVSRSTARGNMAYATPFGTVFKRNGARATMNLTKVDGGGYALIPDKSNFGPQQEAIGFTMTFSDDGTLVFQRTDLSDAAMTGILSNMRSPDISYTAIKVLYEETGEPVTQDQVVDWRQAQDVPVELGTVRNHFSILKKGGRIVVDRGMAVPFDAVHTHHTSIDAVNCEVSDDDDIPAPDEDSGTLSGLTGDTSLNDSPDAESADDWEVI